MSNPSAYEPPTLEEVDLRSIRRIVGQLTEYINNVFNTAKSGKFTGDIHVKGDAYVEDLIMDSESLYLGKKQKDRKLEYNAGDLKFAGEQIGAAMRGVAVFVSATAPSDPQLNDIWIKI